MLKVLRLTVVTTNSDIEILTKKSLILSSSGRQLERLKEKTHIGIATLLHINIKFMNIASAVLMLIELDKTLVATLFTIAVVFTFKTNKCKVKKNILVNSFIF